GHGCDPEVIELLFQSGAPRARRGYPPASWGTSGSNDLNPQRAAPPGTFPPTGPAPPPGISAALREKISRPERDLDRLAGEGKVERLVEPLEGATMGDEGPGVDRTALQEFERAADVVRRVVERALEVDL